MTKSKPDKGSAPLQTDNAASRRTGSRSRRIGILESKAAATTEARGRDVGLVRTSGDEDQAAERPSAGTASASVVSDDSVVARKKSASTELPVAERSGDTARTHGAPETLPCPAEEVDGGAEAAAAEVRQSTLGEVHAMREVAEEAAGGGSDQFSKSSIAGHETSKDKEETAGATEEAIDRASTAFRSAANTAPEEPERNSTVPVPWHRTREPLHPGAVTYAASKPGTRIDAEESRANHSSEAATVAAETKAVSGEKHADPVKALGRDDAKDQSAREVSVLEKRPTSEEQVRAGDDGAAERGRGTDNPPCVVVAAELPSVGPQLGDAESQTGAGGLTNARDNQAKQALENCEGQSSAKDAITSAASGAGEQGTLPKSDAGENTIPPKPGTTFASLSERQRFEASKPQSANSAAVEGQEREGDGLERQLPGTGVGPKAQQSTGTTANSHNNSSGVGNEISRTLSQDVCGRTETLGFGVPGSMPGSVPESIRGVHATKHGTVHIVTQVPGSGALPIGPVGPDAAVGNKGVRKAVPMNVEASAKLEDLRREARKLGEAEYMRGPGTKRPRSDAAGVGGTIRDPVMLKKDKKSQSAYVSRFAAKEYEKLLEKAVQAADALLSAERNRNAAMRQDNADMREQVTALENLVHSGLGAIRSRLSGAATGPDADTAKVKDSKDGVFRIAAGSVEEAGDVKERGRPREQGDEDAVMREQIPSSQPQAGT